METRLTDLELLDIQIDNLFTHDAAGRIVAINEPDGDPAPRFFFGRTGEGNTWRIRHDVPESIAWRLEEAAASEPVPDDFRKSPVNLDPILEALRLDREPAIGHHGPAFRFPGEIPVLDGASRITRTSVPLLGRMVRDLKQLERDFAQVEPWTAVVVDGFAVATCFSSMRSDRAAEARVDTLNEYRGRGYAPAVVAAWARAVRDSGRIPCYGTTWDNIASQAVARKLGLIMYAEGLGIE
jgi:hypothetical protein